MEFRKPKNEISFIFKKFFGFKPKKYIYLHYFFGLFTKKKVS